MNETLEILGKILLGLLRLVAWIIRALYFVAGLRWLFSPNYREEVTKQPWYSRWLVYDVVVWVILLLLACILIAVVSRFLHQT